MSKSKTYPNMQRLVHLPNHTFQWIDCTGSIIFNMDEQSGEVTSIESQTNKITSALDFPKIFRTKPIKDTVPNSQNTFWLLIINNQLYRSNYNIFTKRVEKASRVDSNSTYSSVDDFIEKHYPTSNNVQREALVRFEVTEQQIQREATPVINSIRTENTTKILKSIDEITDKPLPDPLEKGADDEIRPADKPFFDTLLQHTVYTNDENEELQRAISLSLSEQEDRNNKLPISVDKTNIKSIIENYLHLALTNKCITASILIGVATSLAIFLLVCAVINPITLTTAAIVGITSGIAAGTACFFGFNRLQQPKHVVESNHPSNFNKSNL